MFPGKIVTRFAPAPTGALHVGGARTALFNWAYARKHDGRFILRIEDTDRARSSEQSTHSIIEDLQWLGISWDEGPFSQSERLGVYGQHIDRLLKSDRAYVPETEPEIVRFRIAQDVAFDDEVYGRIEVKASELEDFVIRKSDGFPTYHLAVVVDDALMGVTHVIRGQEHLSNTPKHVTLQDALGFDRPVYIHTPSILNPDGSKMSKRDKAKAARRAAERWLAGHGGNQDSLADESHLKLPILEGFLSGDFNQEHIAHNVAKAVGLHLPEIAVQDFRRSGYLSEALLNYIALLGWSPGHNIERFDLDFLVQQFCFDRINKANARFDRNKLLAFNADAIAGLGPQAFCAKFKEYLGWYDSQFLQKLGDRFDAFADAYQPRSPTLGEPTRLGQFFVASTEAIRYDPAAVKKVLLTKDHAGLKVLSELQILLEGCDLWMIEELESRIKAYAQSHALGMGKVAQPLRVAVSGSTVSPPIFDTLAILGKASTLARIERCLASCVGPSAFTGSQ